MTIDIKTIAARMTDEEVRAICAWFLLYVNDEDTHLHHVKDRTDYIYTRLTTPQPQPDDAVTGEDVKVIDTTDGAWIMCGDYRWVANEGWRPVGTVGKAPNTAVFMYSDDALAQRDRIVARGELPRVDGRVATRKECGLA